MNPEQHPLNEIHPRNLVVSKLDYDRGTDEPKLFEFEDDPHHIVRFENFNIINAQIKEEVTPVEAVQRVRDLFDRLRVEYNIVAPVDFEIVESDEGPLLYIITDKITGQDLEDIELNSLERERIIKKFEEFFLSLTQYFINKFNSDELVLWDIPHHSAYRYGTRIGDTSPEIYLVDTDIKITSGKYGITDFFRIIPTIRKFESKSGFKLETVRDRLETFIENLDKTSTAKDEKGKDYYWVKDIRDFLDEN